jgi:RNA polymerase sigma factor (sigma-70 family)
MLPHPETRPSLLVRLVDRADRNAWREFADVYTPVICRLATQRGLQPADADDLAQQVLTSVAKAIGRWQHDPVRAKFGTWLARIAHNAIVNALTRAAPDRAAGDTGVQIHLDRVTASEGPTTDLVRLELRREIFRWAAERIKSEFRPTTWDAFWRTAVENEDPEEVASRLGVSLGAVYTARCRIMRRLKEKVAEFEIEPES